MRHITVALLIPSPVIAIGVTGILRKMHDVDFSIIEISEDRVEEVYDRKPTLIIMDPVVNAFDQLAEYKTENPGFRLIGVIHSSLPSFLQKAFDDTFSIYDSAEAIMQIVRKNIMSEEADSKGKDLSPREKEVIVGIVKGLSNKEIALEMNVSVNTVMTHRRNIASKLHIHTPAGLTIYAIVSNLVKLEDIKDGVAAGKI